MTLAPNDTQKMLETAITAAATALTAEVPADQVGEHLTTQIEASSVTHFFTCTHPGYLGWRWAVTLSAVPGGQASVDEITLLPTSDSILATAWVPWRDRVKPGDLSPGDVLPVAEDDERLVPTYQVGQDIDRRSFKPVSEELGLGRVRVLSITGRNQAAQRWHDGPQGPKSELAQAAPGRCFSCGFMVRLTGELGKNFGVCANVHANDDGRVVAFQHGCGGHSQAQLRTRQLPQPIGSPVWDTFDDLEKF